MVFVIPTEIMTSEHGIWVRKQRVFGILIQVVDLSTLDQIPDGPIAACGGRE